MPQKESITALPAGEHRGGRFSWRPTPLPRCSRSVRGMSQRDVQMVIDEDKVDPAREDKNGVKVQIQLVGDSYRRDVTGGNLLLGEKPVSGKLTRKVRVMGGYGEGEEDKRVFEPARTSGVNPSEYTHVPLPEAVEILHLSAEEIQRLTNARKEGASTPFVDTEQMIRDRGGDPHARLKKSTDQWTIDRGGDPNHRIIKPESSFLLQGTWAEIYNRETQAAGQPESEETCIVFDASIDHSLDGIPW